MRIQNDFSLQYHSTTNRTKSSVSASTQTDLGRNFDSYNNSVSSNANNAFNHMPNAPQGVKDAWEKAEQEIGKENLGIASDGKRSNISGYMLAQIEQQLKTGSGDIFGSSVESAITAAQKILDRLNNPLSASSSAESAKIKENEKDFYKKFIENLTSTQSATKAKDVSPTDVYEQMTGMCYNSIV